VTRLASTACVLALLGFCLPGSARAADIDAAERQKIDYLIATIETLKDAQFIRNDTYYTAKAAADHLRLKLRVAGSRVTSADDFIRYCASSSSVSGKPYLIRFADGREVTAEMFLRQKLTEYETRARTNWKLGTKEAPIVDLSNHSSNPRSMG
jgi:hypothetical protein